MSAPRVSRAAVGLGPSTGHPLIVDASQSPGAEHPAAQRARADYRAMFANARNDAQAMRSMQRQLEESQRQLQESQQQLAQMLRAKVLLALQMFCNADGRATHPELNLPRAVIDRIFRFRDERNHVAHPELDDAVDILRCADGVGDATLQRLARTVVEAVEAWQRTNQGHVSARKRQR